MGMDTGNELVAVVYGGTSVEKDASKANAVRIFKTLTELRYNARMIEYDKSAAWKLKELNPSCVFLCVQGKHHGDGTLQAICDHLEIPYTGSKMTAAAVINDKKVCKYLCRYAGIRTPESRSLTSREFERMDGGTLKRFLAPLGFPFVAKGVTQGGSYGIYLVKDEDGIGKIRELYEYDDELLFEQFIDGRFLTVSILAREGIPQALPVVEGDNREKGDMILFNRPFTVREARISGELKRKLEQSALALFDLYGAESYARVDFMLDEENRPYFLEINAVPGMREESFYPVAAGLAGISFAELVETILKNR